MTLFQRLMARWHRVVDDKRAEPWIEYEARIGEAWQWRGGPTHIVVDYNQPTLCGLTHEWLMEHEPNGALVRINEPMTVAWSASVAQYRDRHIMRLCYLPRLP